jgi:hypothetical protein
MRGSSDLENAVDGALGLAPNVWLTPLNVGGLMPPNRPQNAPFKRARGPAKHFKNQLQEENIVTRKRLMRKILAAAVFAAISASLLSVASRNGPC